ncbi:MAG TPA: riboflavin synthase [Proteobacteria bacterium]|nr:riboflavin synthase [Pseudomonadota bacterium]
MFTGIVETLGTIRKKASSGQGLRLTIEADTKWSDLMPGESIAVNGACLTVADLSGSAFTVDVSPESIRRTTMGRINAGDKVNLERALRSTDRLGGHIVTGHIDATGVILSRQEQAAFTLFSIQIPKGFAKYVIEKGSIAVDGISLTVNDCHDSSFSVSIIPFTARHTTMGQRKTGDVVNIEFDIIGKYVEKLLLRGREDKAKDVKKGRISTEFLAKHGIV